jgi:predicted ATP-grasp superfamily ATP-dependent carboligase
MISKKQLHTLEQYKKPLAFALGNYLTSGLGIARNLGMLNIPTVVFSSDKKQLSFYSRYTIGIQSPDPRHQENQYIDDLETIGKHLKEKGVLLPISDTDTIAILKHRKQLSTYYQFTTPEFTKVNTLLNKQLFYQLLKKKKIPHPKTYFPKNTKDISQILKELSFPCIQKPTYSSYFVQDYHKKLLIARSQQELIDHYQRAQAKNHQLMIQEIIPGDTTMQYGFNAYYTHQYTPTGIFMYQRIRQWPPTFGNGCSIKSIWKPELEKTITPLIKTIQYYGIVDAEFKYDTRDHTIKIIEINPRTWMQNSLPTRHRINIPYLAYQDALGKTVKSTLPLKDTIKWIYIIDDIKSAWNDLHTGTVTLQEWIQSYQGHKEYAVLSRNDPLPFFILCANLIFSPIKLVTRPD